MGTGVDVTVTCLYDSLSVRVRHDCAACGERTWNLVESMNGSSTAMDGQFRPIESSIIIETPQLVFTQRLCVVRLVGFLVQFHHAGTYCVGLYPESFEDQLYFLEKK